MQIKTKVWLEEDGHLLFGGGKAMILKAVFETGSINKAAKLMNMSYRHAWSYIRSIEKRIGKDLLIKSKGGAGGGGAVLTNYAKDLLAKYEKLDTQIMLFADKHYKAIFGTDGKI